MLGTTLCALFLVPQISYSLTNLKCRHHPFYTDEETEVQCILAIFSAAELRSSSLGIQSQVSLIPEFMLFLLYHTSLLLIAFQLWVYCRWRTKYNKLFAFFFWSIAVSLNQTFFLPWASSYVWADGRWWQLSTASLNITFVSYSKTHLQRCVCGYRWSTE